MSNVWIIKIVLITTAVLNALTLAQQTDIGECQWAGTFKGGSIERKYIGTLSSPSFCESQCKKNEDCTAYTFTNNGMCILRSKTHGPLNTGGNSNGAVSGIVDCQRLDSCKKAGVSFERRNNRAFIRSRGNIDSYTGCWYTCRGTPGCVVFSYLQSSRDCVLRDGNALEGLQTQDMAITSGIMMCGGCEWSSTVSDTQLAGTTLSSRLTYSSSHPDRMNGNTFEENVELCKEDCESNYLCKGLLFSPTSDSTQYCYLRDSTDRSSSPYAYYTMLVTCDRSSCPEDYPYAFSNGDKCCANDIEGTDGTVGELCDGGDIGLDSSCCLDDEHLECSDKPCSNYEGPPELEEEYCVVNPPPSVAISTRQVPVGLEAVSYCIEDPRKNAVIKCQEARTLEPDSWEFPDCDADLLANTGHCEYTVPPGVLTNPGESSGRIPVGSSLVAFCSDGGYENPTIMPCKPGSNIQISDFPSC